MESIEGREGGEVVVMNCYGQFHFCRFIDYFIHGYIYKNNNWEQLMRTYDNNVD